MLRIRNATKSHILNEIRTSVGGAVAGSQHRPLWHNGLSGLALRRKEGGGSDGALPIVNTEVGVGKQRDHRARGLARPNATLELYV